MVALQAAPSPRDFLEHIKVLKDHLLPAVTFSPVQSNSNYNRRHAATNDAESPREGLLSVDVLQLCIGIERRCPAIVESELTPSQAFLIFGYDAGVLGGVQTTKPFLDALKVGLSDSYFAHMNLTGCCRLLAMSKVT